MSTNPQDFVTVKDDDSKSGGSPNSKTWNPGDDANGNFIPGDAVKDADNPKYGYLMNIREGVGTHKSNVYDFETEDNQKFSVWGCDTLDKKMEATNGDGTRKVNIGDYVMLTFEGWYLKKQNQAKQEAQPEWKPARNDHYKLFNVGVHPTMKRAYAQSAAFIPQASNTAPVNPVQQPTQQQAATTTTTVAPVPSSLEPAAPVVQPTNTVTNPQPVPDPTPAPTQASASNVVGGGGSLPNLAEDDLPW